jgi:hypothetical protein
VQERFAKHTRLAHFIYAVERCVSRIATNDSAEAAVRERNPKKMSEAPVKYELTGASCHLRAEARGVA